MISDILNVISSAHSEFEYTVRCKAPDAGVLLNMESACAYLARFGTATASQNVTDFLQEYLHSDRFRTAYREIIPSFVASPYGQRVTELAGIENMLNEGDKKGALDKWSETKKLLPETLKVVRNHYGQD
jgi:hypothetical protein